MDGITGLHWVVDEALISLALMLLFDVLKSLPPFREGSTVHEYIPLMAMGLGIATWLVWAGSRVASRRRWCSMLYWQA